MQNTLTSDVLIIVFIAVILSAIVSVVLTLFLTARYKNRLKEHVNQQAQKLSTLYMQEEALNSTASNLTKQVQRDALTINSLTEREDAFKQRQIHDQNTINQQKTHIAELENDNQQQRQKWITADKKSEVLLATSEHNQQHIQALKEQLENANTHYEKLTQDFQKLNNSHTQLTTEMTEREASHHREVSAFEKQKAGLSEQFKVLSQQILEEKSRVLQNTSQQSLQSIINPFTQSIDQFKKEVQDIHHRETTQRSELKKEIETLRDLNLQITTEAHELSTALKGQKKLQGNWGELVLENVLDRAGLQLGSDYKREMSITTEDGRKRPDAVVFLPQKKHLIIDAKVSLNAYTRYVNAEDDTTRQSALNEHVKAMTERINELAARDYYALPNLNSPAMVFMFVPIESAFVEALKADETLFQKAIDNNVLVATPTTLLTSLNIVKQLWRFEDQNKHTAALAKRAESVFKKLNTFLGSFDAIKKGLNSATDAYTKAENQLVSGKGNLVKQVGEFKNLAPSIKGQLPTHFEEKAALEIDFASQEACTSNTLDD